jgi:LAO/AO transport system kinase
MTDLTANVLKGDHRSIARLITLLENSDPDAIASMKTLYSHTGHAHVIGVTGVMGSGKSSLLYELTKAYRQLNKKIGIIAIDPTSPFSGGALLGDRIRMTELSTDPCVFIRSMGTRGALGGLANAVYDVVDILDAAGMDIILIETVGVGQDEVEVVKVADTTIVVTVPGLGDAVQTIKAGLMEIADIFAVNKADRPGIEQTIAELQSMVDLSMDRDWKIPILAVSAKEKKGMNSLIESIAMHERYARDSHLFEDRRRTRYETELLELLRRRIISYVLDDKKLKDQVDDCLKKISVRELDPYTAADDILNALLK